MPVQSLPSELLTNVFETLDTHPLYSATLVDVRFNKAAEPQLYRAPKILGNPDLVDDEDEDPNEAIFQFACTLIARPALGNLVREITLGWEDPDEDEYQVLDFKDLDKDIDAKMEHKLLSTMHHADQVKNTILPASEKLGVSRRMVLESGCLAHLLIILHHLPRLQHLHLIESCSYTGVLGSVSLGLVRGGVPIALRNITSLELELNRDGEGFATTELVPFFALPSLQRLKGTMCFVDDMQIGGDPANGETPLLRGSSVLLPQSSSIKELEFDSSDFDTSILHKILLLPRALESLSYTVAGKRFVKPLFECSRLSKALDSHSKSLRRLVINADDAEADDFDGTLDSFAAFEALEHAVIPVFALYGAPPTDSDNNTPYPTLSTFLTPALKTLELRLDPDWTLASFATVTGLPQSWSSVKSAFPSLHHVVIHCSDSADSEPNCPSNSEFLEAGIEVVEREW